jgi:hypothetical protein
MSFKIPYLYDFVTELCRKQATVILDHENVNILIIGQVVAQHRKYKRLELVVVRQTIDQFPRQWIYP